MSSGYDLSASTFSPDGRVFQVEYALKAVEKSGTTIGIKCVDGVVLGVENPVLNRMLVPGGNRRIFTVDEHAGVAMAGFAADARKIVKLARHQSSQYRKFYGSQIPGHILNSRLASEVHYHTLFAYLRPFGTSILIASYDSNGPQLYQIDPSGIGHRYFAAAVGKAKNGAGSELEKIDFTSITVKEAVKLIAKIIYKLHDDIKDKEFELDMSWICKDSDFKHVRIPEDLRQEAIRYAKADKAREEMDDSDDEKAWDGLLVIKTDLVVLP